MSIQKQITVRYKEYGHVRFQIPEQLTQEGAVNQLIDQLNALECTYRTKVFRGQKKLSIRYHEALCDFTELAKHLFVIIEQMEKQGWFKEKRPKTTKKISNGLQSKVSGLKFTRWVNDQYTAAKETVQAAKVITKLGMKKPKALIKDPEKAVIDFLNDVLILYLIKLHWPRITKEWIPSPWMHRYEWLAIFYLFFLLVRSRRPKK